MIYTDSDFVVTPTYIHIYTYFIIIRYVHGCMYLLLAGGNMSINGDY